MGFFCQKFLDPFLDDFEAYELQRWKARKARVDARIRKEQSEYPENNDWQKRENREPAIQELFNDIPLAEKEIFDKRNPFADLKKPNRTRRNSEDDWKKKPLNKDKLRREQFKIQFRRQLKERNQEEERRKALTPVPEKPNQDIIQKIETVASTEIKGKDPEIIEEQQTTTSTQETTVVDPKQRFINIQDQLKDPRIDYWLFNEYKENTVPWTEAEDALERGEVEQVVQAYFEQYHTL